MELRGFIHFLAFPPFFQCVETTGTSLGTSTGTDFLGLSWTTSLKIAKGFAERFNMSGTIYSTTLKPDEILAAYADDGEHEVLAIVPETGVETI